MVGVFLGVVFVIYIVLSWMIVYHLQTYTINKVLAKHAIALFAVVTTVLIIVQFVLFLRIETMAVNAVEEVRTDAFGGVF